MADFRKKKTTILAGSWIAYPRQLIESYAMRALTLAERRALNRIEIEHMSHGGAENGRLPVTYADFEKWGVRSDTIAGAIRALEALGLIEITRKGYGGAADVRAPSLYRLAYIGACHAGKTDASGTHEYTRFKSLEEADATARTARQNLDPRNRGKSKRRAAPETGEISSPCNVIPITGR